MMFYLDCQLDWILKHLGEYYTSRWICGGVSRDDWCVDQQSMGKICPDYEWYHSVQLQPGYNKKEEIGLS